jgi:erythronate-4-phosphate dehydrogenase
MVLAAFCRHFGLEREWDPSPLMPPPARPRVRIPAGVGADEAMRRAIAAAYPIEEDDRRLRRIAEEPPEDRARYFSSLRRSYPVRREFPETAAELEEAPAGTERMLTALGFPVQWMRPEARRKGQA